MNEIIILSVFIIDFIFGDPKLIFPHPIELIGKLIYKTESFFFAIDLNKKLSGFLFTFFIVAVVFLVIRLMLSVFSLCNVYLDFLLTVLLGSFTLSLRSLHVETEKVFAALKKGNITEARKELSMLVSRDTEQLEETDILRSVIETVAENITDGIISPLFYLALFGIPGAFVYKAINTLDSMIGYKNEKYLRFGWFAAKVDDILNFIPARIAGLLIVISSFFLMYDFKNSFRIMLRDRKNTDSPNSAWTEAAVAGALNIRLGGATPYFGVWYDKPFIGDNIVSLSYNHIEKTYKILYLTSFLFLFVLLLFLKG